MHSKVTQATRAAHTRQQHNPNGNEGRENTANTQEVAHKHGFCNHQPPPMHACPPPTHQPFVRPRLHFLSGELHIIRGTTGGCSRNARPTPLLSQVLHQDASTQGVPHREQWRFGPNLQPHFTHNRCQILRLWVPRTQQQQQQQPTTTTTTNNNNNNQQQQQQPTTTTTNNSNHRNGTTGQRNMNKRNGGLRKIGEHTCVSLNQASQSSHTTTGASSTSTNHDIHKWH